MNNIMQRIITMCFMAPGILFAESNNFTGSSVDPASFIKMFVGLIVVLALIFIVGWLTRKLKLVQNFSTGYQIKNLASLSVSHREKVSLIEVGGKQILIGIAAGRVDAIHLFEESIELDDPKQLNEQTISFSEQFKKAMGLSSMRSTS